MRVQGYENIIQKRSQKQAEYQMNSKQIIIGKAKAIDMKQTNNVQKSEYLTQLGKSVQVANVNASPTSYTSKRPFKEFIISP